MQGRVLAASSVLILVLFSIACEGCNGSAGPKAYGPVVGSRTVDSNGNNYSVTYSCQPDPIPLNEPFSLNLLIIPKRPLQEDILTVKVDAQMPEHLHGMNRRPDIKMEPNSKVVASGMLFHMPGHWQVHIDIARKGITERAQFDLTLK